MLFIESKYVCWCLLGVYGVFTGLVLFETKENESGAKKTN